MLYQGDIGLYLSGAPVPIPECVLFITQPTIKQIEQFGETDFLMAVQLLSETEEMLKSVREGNPELADISIFQLLLASIEADESIKNNLDIFFELVFPEYNIYYEKNSINFSFKNNEDEKIINGMVTIYSFEKFQRVIKELFSIDTTNEKDFNPVNDQAAEIARKLKKGREKRSDNKNSKMSLYGTYASILAIGLQMDINIFFNYTPFQIIDAFKRYWEKDKSDLYRKISTTPLMDVSKMDAPEEWTRNFYLADNN